MQNKIKLFFFNIRKDAMKFPAGIMRLLVAFIDAHRKNIKDT